MQCRERLRQSAVYGNRRLVVVTNASQSRNTMQETNAEAIKIMLATAWSKKSGKCVQMFTPVTAAMKSQKTGPEQAGGALAARWSRRLIPLACDPPCHATREQLKRDSNSNGRTKHACGFLRPVPYLFLAPDP